MKIKKLAILSGVMLVIMASLFTAIPVMAELGLRVDGAIAEINADPGKIYKHTMIVRSNQDYPEMDVTITPFRLGQELDGSYKTLPADKSENAYSAYEFINRIDNNAFRLEPGGAQKAEATIDVPSSVKKSGGRYAVLHIRPQLGTMKDTIAMIIPNIYVPIVLNFGSWDLKGKISDLVLGNIESGKPIQCKVTLKNTGNFHYRAKNSIAVTDSTGKEILKKEAPLTSVSIIPDYAFRFDMDLELTQLPIGMYEVKSKASLENGTVLDTKSTTFEIKKNYVRYENKESETPFAMNWSFIGGTVAVVGVVAALLLKLSRRKEF